MALGHKNNWKTARLQFIAGGCHECKPRCAAAMQCTRMVIVVLTAACLLRPLPPAVTPRGAAQAGQVTWRCVTNRRKSLSSCHRGASLCSRDLRLLVPVGPMGQGAGCCWVALDVASPVELPEEHLEQY